MENIFWNINNNNTFVSFFFRVIKDNNEFHTSYELCKNLSYNCQYLEFLSNALNNRIHNSLRTEFIKTYVIIGMSIIESILYYFLKSKNLHKTNNYCEISVLQTNDKKVNNTWIRAVTTIYKKLDIPIEEEMNLDIMLKKSESNKVLGNDTDVYKELNRLRKLRNKVHLYLIEKNFDTDWNNFSLKELQLIKIALYKVLFSEVFIFEDDESLKLFSFLQIK